MDTVASIILAAGASRRLGEAKQFLRHDGETLVHRSARATCDAALSPIVVVTGEAYHQIVAEMSGLNVTVLKHAGWERGIGSSIRAGLERVLRIDPCLEGIVISVCDQPFISAEILQSLIVAWKRKPADIAATTYGGTIGVPALFPRALFPRLQELPDSAGAKGIMLEMRETITEIPFPLGAVDIDTPEDLGALIRRERTTATQPGVVVVQGDRLDDGT